MNEKEKELKLEIGKEIHRLKYGFYLIGRNTNDVEHHIPINDKSVDIKHAILEFTQNETILIDLCSKNGTYVDDLSLKIGEHYKLPASSSLSIKFGDILGHLCITSKEDSGYHGFISPSHQQNNISDIVPVSPERNISQTTLRSRLLGLNSKFNSSSQSAVNTSKSANSTLITNSSILVASTQPNTSIYRYNENIRKNIELLEEDDDFYIPETQEVFNKENHQNSHLESVNNEQVHQKQQQNRIFDETESIMRICTQDFNVIDEGTTDSDDLLRNVAMPIDDINSKEITEDKTKNIVKENDKKIIVKNVEITGNFVNDEDDVDTDCEEEMSALKWNESSSNKITLNVRNSKSASMTPELNIENNFQSKSGSVTPDINFENKLLSLTSKSQQNMNECEPKSGSVTPDLDVNQIILEYKKNNSEKSYNKLQNIEEENNLSLEKTNNNKDIDNNSDDDDDDDEFLGPTQPFIRKPFTKVLTPIDKKSDKLLTNISPSNKENSLHNSNNESNDDSLEDTQIFIFDKNKYNAAMEKTVSDSVKQQLFIDSDKKKSTDNFLKPSLPLISIKKNLTSTPKSIAQFKMNNCDNDDKNDDDDDDDDDDELGPTQIFEYPAHIKVINSKSESKSSSSIAASTVTTATTITAASATTTTTKSKLDDDKNDDDDDDDELGPTQLFEYPAHNKVINSKSESKSSSSIVASTVTTATTIAAASATTTTTAAGSATTTTKSKLDDDNDDDDDDDDELGPTQIFEYPAHIKVMNLKNESKSSSSAIGDGSKITKNKNENNKKSTSPIPSANTSFLLQFNFDICTPNWDNLKLPPVEKIKEAGKVFSEISKNQKHNKCIFEESSSSEDSNDGDFFKNPKNYTKSTKKPENLEINKNIKNEKESMKTRKNKNNKIMTEKNDLKIEKDESVKSKNMQVHVKLTRYNTRKINEQNNHNVKNKKIENNSKHEEHKIENQDQLRTTRSQGIKKKIEEESSKIQKQSESEEIKPGRRITKRLTSKDLEIALIDKSNHKRSNDDAVKNDLPNKRKKINENPTSSSAASSSSLSISKSFQLNLTKPKIVFTKVDPTKYKNELRKIGARIVTNPLDCTILVAEQIYWTSKLMAAMAKGIPIVTPNWIKDASEIISSKNKNSSLLSIEDYILKDHESERKYKFNLRKSLNLAREKPVFDGYSFYITPKTKPPPEELIMIINCGKGKVLRTIPKQLNINNFYVVSDKDDMILWHKIRQNYKNVQIINPDGILMAALQQKINFKNYLLRM